MSHGGGADLDGEVEESSEGVMELQCKAAVSYRTGRDSGHRCGQRAGRGQATWARGLRWTLGF